MVVAGVQVLECVCVDGYVTAAAVYGESSSVLTRMLCVRDLSCLVSVYPSICMTLFWLVLFSHVSVRVIT